MSEHDRSADAWARLKSFTAARIGLGRSGSAMPTHEVLKFSLAHAQARDAVITRLHWPPIENSLHALGLTTVHASSSAGSRDVYLRRPDLGRELSPASRQELSEIANTARQDGKPPDIAVVVADGLSSKAVSQNVAKLLAELLPYARKAGWKLAPVILADQARVAFGDEIGELLGAKVVIVLIGERPGLSSPDSLGVYLTWAPKRGRKDNDRNCISNVRPGGLGYDEGAFKLAWLLKEAFRRQLSGVNLKDESSFQIDAGVSAKQIG